MYRLAAFFLSIIGLVLAISSSVSFQEQPGEIILRATKIIGYSSGTGKMQGLFSLKVSGGEDLERVEFLIDDQLLGEDREAPFEINFSTDAYSLGEHTLSARGFTAGGTIVESNILKVQFVSSEQGMQAALQIVVPLIGIILLAMLVSAGIPLLTGRRKTIYLPPGAPRKYGALGGTICPKCGRPFSLHFYSLNLGLNKLERCPYCGKWSLVRRVDREQLLASEAAELERSRPPEERHQLEEEERLQRRLDESKYEDL